ncbi:MAG: hypothetical protein FVQ79_01025 [Planctomycetes bacterium]|nr:hypothetical protein [Planctomycetota bacterium]
MPNDRQIAANRNNALKSTGPRTSAGKVAVSQNAVTHGLMSNQVVIKGESRQDFEDFRNRLIKFFQPVGELEQLLTDRISASFWRQSRAGRIEVEILNAMFDPLENSPAKPRSPLLGVEFTLTYDDAPDEQYRPIECMPEDKPKEGQPETEKPAELTLGQAISADFSGGNILGKFRRYEAHIDRTLYKALHELQRLQSARKGQKVAPPTMVDIDVTGIPESEA